MIDAGAALTTLFAGLATERRLVSWRKGGLLSGILRHHGAEILSESISSCRNGLARLILSHRSLRLDPAVSLDPEPLDAAVKAGNVGLVASLVQREARFTRATLKNAVQSQRAAELLPVLLPYVIPTGWRRTPDFSRLSMKPLEYQVEQSTELASQSLVMAARLGKRRVVQLLREAVC